MKTSQMTCLIPINSTGTLRRSKKLFIEFGLELNFLKFGRFYKDRNVN